MDIIYTETMKSVAIGDVVKYKDAYCRVVDMSAPTDPRGLGRVKIKSIENPFASIKEIMPYEIGAEWIKYC